MARSLFFRAGPVKIGSPRIGLALGSGAARGWAHIGVLKALAAAQIPIHVVAGCSAGAVIGAFYAAGAIDVIEEFALGYRGLRETFKYLDFAPRSGGIVAGKKFLGYLEGNLPARNFSELKIPFGVVATDLVQMEEVHISEGPLLPAIRASVAVPGFLSPLDSPGRQLVDGGLLNPVPVNLARKLGADIVIAVDLNGSFTSEPAASFGEVMTRSIDTMRNRLKKINFRMHSPDILIEPILEDVGFLDYHKTKDTIESGRLAAGTVLATIKKLI